VVVDVCVSLCVCVCPAAGASDGVNHFDPMLIEKWPLIQAFAIEGFGRLLQLVFVVYRNEHTNIIAGSVCFSSASCLLECCTISHDRRPSAAMLEEVETSYVE